MSDQCTFESLKFDNLVLQKLPIDKETDNYCRQVKDACFSKIKPTPCLKPSMVAYSKSAMLLIDLDESELKRKEAPEYLSGNEIIPGSETAAHCYCGHQFGHFAGQLGDGAAMYLGEVLNKKGERWELQLKGAGLTPYSRSADGRKVLRSTLREFLCSEGMYFLNVPTTRAGSCIMSESKVVRDIHYDGNPKLENCAVVLRISPTFLRFGSFEAFMANRGPQFNRPNITKQLLNYTCENFFAEATNECNTNVEKYEKFLEDVIKRTAKLVAEWQCCGFVHGVLNTDNMSILGLTIDYGPFGFLERYDPNFIFNGSDTGGRYTYKNQPEICEWNLIKLAEALDNVMPLNRSKQIVKESYQKEFKKFYLEKMRKKLGLLTEREDDADLIENFLATLRETGCDFTNSFRKLNSLKLNGLDKIQEDIDEYINDVVLKECRSIEETLESIKPKFKPETLEKLLNAVQENPEILQYYGLSEMFIKNEVENMEKYQKIKNWTQDDKYRRDAETWNIWLKKYLTRVYHELETVDVDFTSKRVLLMNANNPRFILRNHVAQSAIESIEVNGDNNEAHMLLRILENAFSEQSLEKILEEFSTESSQRLIQERAKSMFYEKPADLKKCVKLSCSS